MQVRQPRGSSSKPLSQSFKQVLANCGSSLFEVGEWYFVKRHLDGSPPFFQEDMVFVKHHVRLLRDGKSECASLVFDGKAR